MRRDLDFLNWKRHNDKPEEVVADWQRFVDDLHDRAESPFLSFSRFDFERAVMDEHDQQWRDYAQVRTEFEVNAVLRRLRWIDLELYVQRTRQCQHDGGSARIERKAFSKWLNLIRKIMPDKKALKAAAPLELSAIPVYQFGRRDWVACPTFTTITLDFLPRGTVAYLWQITPDADISLAAFALRYPAHVLRPLTVRVDFETLREVVTTATTDILTISSDDQHLIVVEPNARNRTRIKRAPINERLIGYWKGFDLE